MEQRQTPLSQQELIEQAQAEYNAKVELLKRQEEEAFQALEQQKKLQDTYPAKVGKTINIDQPVPSTPTQINFGLDIYKFLISLLSKTVILGVFLMLLYVNYPEMSLETKGFIFSIYLAMTGTSLIKGQTDKKLEAMKEVEKIKITPLNEEITNQIKSLLPTGQG